MSGHSKWSTIKRSKGAADIKRGMTFTKLANAITLAAKLGNSGDSDSNPRLRDAMDAARSANMPKDNVQRAIDRGLGKLPGQILEEVLYEGFGPGKVAFILEGITDNKLRTLQGVKNLFERNGGAMASPGATSYMFERIGEIRVLGKGGVKDDEILELIDLGVLDVEDFLDEPFDSALDKNIQKYLVFTEGSELNTMSNKITQAGFTVESSELVYKPNLVVEIKDQVTAKRVLEFTEKLEGLGDIQKVFANFDISEEAING